MTDQPTPLYRLDQELADIIWQQERTDYRMLLIGALRDGVLVLVEPCEHGMIPEHTTSTGYCKGAGIGGDE